MGGQPVVIAPAVAWVLRWDALTPKTGNGGVFAKFPG
jgi:hypothetical protein